MTKKEFMERARTFTKIIPDQGQQEKEMVALEVRRAQHLAEVAAYDAEAARLERAFFDADSARAEAEIAVARHYASRMEDS